MNTLLANSAVFLLKSRLLPVRAGRHMGAAPFVRKLPRVSPCRPRSFSGTLPGRAVSNRGGAIIPGISSSTPLHLPPADGPVGLQLYKKAIYCPVSRVIRTSAHVGSDDSNQKADGIVGDTVTPEEAKNHARNSGLRILATIHDFLDGDMDRVEQVLHLKGMVKSKASFAGHASVIDGCSEVLAEAFGPDVGVGTRECFGVGSLGATVACTLEVRVSPPTN